MLDDPSDPVRIEIEAALNRKIRVIPVLVDGASMPAVAALPESLKVLTRLQPIELSSGSFDSEMARLEETVRGRPHNFSGELPVKLTFPGLSDLMVSSVKRIARSSEERAARKTAGKKTAAKKAAAKAPAPKRVARAAAPKGGGKKAGPKKSAPKKAAAKKVAAKKAARPMPEARSARGSRIRARASAEKSR
jgi:hypothetical protein